MIKKLMKQRQLVVKAYIHGRSASTHRSRRATPQSPPLHRFEPCGGRVPRLTHCHSAWYFDFVFFCQKMAPTLFGAAGDVGGREAIFRGKIVVFLCC
jgi:hypothetical protein